MLSKDALQRTIRRDRTATLVVNTSSRTGHLLFERARALLRASGITVTASYPVADPRMLNETFQAALAGAPALLIVGSGDGTISEVIDHLAYRDTVLGFLPLGTTNNFARSLGIPLSLPAAVETIAEGKVADIDLGKLGEDYFANVASIGVSVRIAASVSPALKRRVGRLAYAASGATALLTHQPFTARVTIEGRVLEARTHQLVIANGRFHSGTQIAADASIDDHQLVIFALGGPTRRQLARSITGFVLRDRPALSTRNYLPATHAVIETDPVQAIEIDGEIKTQTPITATVAAEALKVMVPRAFADD